MNSKSPLHALWISTTGHQHLHNYSKLTDFGFNALILGGLENESYIETFDLCNGVNTILQFRPQSMPRDYLENLLSRNPLAILWISENLKHNPEDTRTLSERLRDEICNAQRIIKGRSQLIFYVPFDSTLRGWRNPKLLTELCLVCNRQTAIAFSFVAGNPSEDHLPSHPFLEQRLNLVQQHSTPLYPIVNSGNVSHGEGRWPLFSFDLFESLWMHTAAIPFTGCISIAQKIPESIGFLEANLWAAGQLFVSPPPPEALLETWFKKHYPKVNFSKAKPLIKHIRQLVICLCHLNDTAFESEDKQILKDISSAHLNAISLGGAKEEIGAELRFQIQEFLNEIKAKI